MTEAVYGKNYKQTDRGPVFIPCALHGILAKMGDKWTILVLSSLMISEGNRLRFSAIKKSVEGISQRMLTLTLRNLERDGLVIRHYFAEVPPRVEYELSERGKSLLPALTAFIGWIRENWPDIELSRQQFDVSQAG